MAFAQLSYHMGFRERVRRSTLADANETRDYKGKVALSGRQSGASRRS
jgi:hypothetical protein